MGMTNFDLFALVVFGMAVLGYAAWRQAKRIGEKFEADFKAQCEKDAKRYGDAADKVRYDHEKTTQINLERYNEKRRMQAEIDEAWRRKVVYEADHYNESASMEPFFGKGKKS